MGDLIKEVESSMLYKSRDGRDILKVAIPFRVFSKSNYRFGDKIEWEKEKKFKKEIYLFCSSLRKEITTFGGSGHNLATVIITWSKYDTGNTSKSILDAFEGVVYDNDNCIASVNSINIREKRDMFIVYFTKISELGTTLTLNTINEAVIDLNSSII